MTIHRTPNAPAQRREHRYHPAFVAEMERVQRQTDDEADWAALEARASSGSTPKTRLEADLTRMEADDDAQRAAMRRAASRGARR